MDDDHIDPESGAAEPAGAGIAASPGRDADRVRDLILERRRRFMAAALAGLGVGAQGACEGTQQGVDPAAVGLPGVPTTATAGEPEEPRVCLRIAPQPIGCLSAGGPAPQPSVPPNEPPRPLPVDPFPNVCLQPPDPGVCLSVPIEPPPVPPTVVPPEDAGTPMDAGEDAGNDAGDDAGVPDAGVEDPDAGPGNAIA